jgi:hypothetical protein
MPHPTGFVVYEGPSQLDGSPIVGILTLESGNAKTGNMAQLWILAADQSPVDAVRSGADAGICGDCVHRGTDGFKGRTCYVNVAQGPGSVWRAWKRGAYPEWTGTLPPVMRDRGVRLGAYGDPAALPEWEVRRVALGAKFWTGYTHQWRRFDWLRPFVMASVDSEAEAIEARAAGWRYYRAATEGAAPLAKESVCPSESVGIQCAKCGACDGIGSARSGSIRITVHGIGAQVFANRTGSATMAPSSR